MARTSASKGSFCATSLDTDLKHQLQQPHPTHFRGDAKILFCLIDGLGDVSLHQLQNQTPLESAATPSLDSLAAQGVNGLMDPVSAGLACGSDTAHLSLFGYDPSAVYRGRGSFESIGSGLLMQRGDVAFKCNFATLDSQQIVSKRRCDRSFHQWGTALCDAIHNLALPAYPDVQVACKYATEHRCGVRIRAPNLTDEISGTDPLTDNLPLLKCRPVVDASSTEFAKAQRTSEIVNALSDAIQSTLSQHAITLDRQSKGLSFANCVLLRGAGQFIDVPSFKCLHGFERAVYVAPTAIISGLCQSIGLRRLECTGATGDYGTDLFAKANASCDALLNQEADFCFLHVKAVDDCGHDRDIDGKVTWIEKCDSMVQCIVDRLSQSSEPVIVCVTGDHSTATNTGDHSHQPVPVIVAQINVQSQIQSAFTELCAIDSVERFSELAAEQGSLSRFRGGQLMSLLIKSAKLAVQSKEKIDSLARQELQSQL